MRVREVPKPYSWLQWPVNLTGLSDKLWTHVTAKFFGDAKIDRLAVIGRIPLQQSMWFSSEFFWSPTIFQGQHVLELLKFPEEMREIHDRFDVIEDQFKPWRPHITVPHEYWVKVSIQGLTPQTEALTFGEIELCLGQVNKTATARGKGAKYANHN